MKHKLFTMLALLLIADTLSAQTVSIEGARLGLTSILVAVNVVLLLFVIFLMGTLTTAVQKLRTGNDNKVKLTWWEKFVALKTEKTEDELKLDEDFDGIYELNNPTPPWFNFIFYTSIIVAFLYLLNYHVFKFGNLQIAEYNVAVQESKVEVDAYLKKTGNAVDENNVTFLTDKKSINEGSIVFAEKCAVCHMTDGGGLVGPNLTDKYWRHGGDVKSIFKTLKYGVPAKGMIAWQNAYSGKQMQAIASYVLTLQGTKPAKGKEPQGVLFIGAGDATIYE
jgi:cytochrome c oxidase cbb3-type subunit 3